MPIEQFTVSFPVAGGAQKKIVNIGEKAERSVFVTVTPVGVDAGTAAFRVAQQNDVQIIASDQDSVLTDVVMANNTDRVHQGMDVNTNFDGTNATIEYFPDTETVGQFDVLVTIK